MNKPTGKPSSNPFLMNRWAMVSSPIYITRRALAAAIMKLAGHVEGDVLDFGCGSKPYESLFQQARRYTGVDIAVSGHSHADSKVDVFYDGKTLPFPAEAFDAVVSFEVIEHVFNLESMLKEMHRVLKPGGALLLSAPFSWEEHEQPYDFARYTSFGLKHLLHAQGFELVRHVKTTSHFLAVCQSALSYISQHLAPKGVHLRRLFILLTVFPMNVLALVLDRILPKTFDYYCNNVFLCRKR